MKSHDLRQSLEDELAADPEDLATHVAYADLLSEQDDPRGEFIQVQMALEDPHLEPGERARLQQREHELLLTYWEKWLGRLAPCVLAVQGTRNWQIPPLFTFRRGWLDRLQIDWLSLNLARALRDAPQTRLLRDLTILDAHADGSLSPEPDDNIPEEDHQHGLWPLVGAPALGNVQRLQLGSDDGEDWTRSRCRLVTTAVPLLVRSCPRLEELHLFASGYQVVDLFSSTTLDHLRVLQVHHLAAIHRLDVLANNRHCRHLTHLLLHPHRLAWPPHGQEDEKAGFHREDGYLPLGVVRPLLHSSHLPRLTHLQLRLSSLGDDGCREIVASGILHRLRRLDLRHGRIGDAGARILADCPETRRLEWLDLSYNSLSAEGIRPIEELGIPVKLDSQHASPPGSGDRADRYLDEGAGD